MGITTWVIRRAALDTVITMIARPRPDQPTRPRAVAKTPGKALAGAPRATARDGVAIVPVRGIILRRAGLLSQVLDLFGVGSAVIDDLAADLAAALSDPDVRAILLDIDSPGGEANGVGELAGMIRAARGRKPVGAYVGGDGCSGAYWIASAASRITAAPTALLGSIGVIVQYEDDDRAAREAGVDRYVITSSHAPRKALTPATEQGRLEVQMLVDAIEHEFLSDVAANRGLPLETVLSDFGGGGILVGPDAVRAGMADRLGTFEAVLADLARAGGAGDVPVPAAAKRPAVRFSIRSHPENN